MVYEFKTEAKLGSRIKKYGDGITVYSNDKRTLWWYSERHGWINDISGMNSGFSNYKQCKSLKAFKRHVRKHMSHIKNAEIMLSNKFIGYDWVVNV